MLLAIWKSLRFFYYMAAYLVSATWIKWTVRDANERLRRYTENCSYYARIGLRILNVEVRVKGEISAGNHLIVCNHMSYLDVLVMSSIRPSVFVTSVDMGEVFFLGTMAELGGSVFVERRHRERVSQDRNVLAETLRAGFDVVLFPEGTSSDGSTVLPFKRGLLAASVEAQRSILPAVLRYRRVNDEPFGQSNHQTVCWYGSMAFLPHLLGLFRMQHLEVEMHFLPVLAVGPHWTRDELAFASHEKVHSAYSMEPAAI